MSTRTSRWIVLELFRPVVSVGKLVGKIFRTLFGHRDVQLSKTREENLAKEISSEMPFLFDRYRGKVVPDESVKYPRPFDYASVVVAVDDLRLRFFRGRGDLRVHVAQKEAPSEWYELHVLLSVIEGRAISEPLLLIDVARLLESRLTNLEEAFSKTNYPELRRRLSNVDEDERAAIRQWETDVNRRLRR
jgi:hypothetical protein